MTELQYQQPEFKKENFYCPHCLVLAHQHRSEVYCRINQMREIHDLNISYCQNCKNYSLWKGENMIYPRKLTAPISHIDMPDDVKEIYEEARHISDISPRASAALLRVALEKLTVHLGETEGNLNTRVGNLKKQGLPEKVIKGLDIVRITANEGGSHSGTIDLTGEDNSEIVNKLFRLINFIIEKTISENQEIDALFDNLPEDKKKGIQNRDK